MNTAHTVPQVVFCEIMLGDPLEAARPFTDKQTGLQKLIKAKQTAWLWVGKRHPVEIKVEVPDEGPYRPGNYFLGGAIFAAGDYGRPAYKGDREMVLVPVAEAFAALMPPREDSEEKLKAVK